mgnify:FL=1
MIRLLQLIRPANNPDKMRQNILALHLFVLIATNSFAQPGLIYILQFHPNPFRIHAIINQSISHLFDYWCIHDSILLRIHSIIWPVWLSLLILTAIWFSLLILTINWFIHWTEFLFQCIILNNRPNSLILWIISIHSCICEISIRFRFGYIF